MTSSLYAKLWDTGKPVPDSAIERVDRPYQQSEWVYICVNALITAARSFNLMLSTTNDEIVESGKMYDLLFASDPTFSEFLTTTVGLISLDKQAYWIFAEKELQVPQKIIVASKRDLKPNLRRGIITGYWYKLPDGTRIPLFVEDVHPVIDFNPYDHFSGIGPAIAGSMAINTTYQSALYNESTLANGGRLGTVISYPTNIPEDEKTYLREQFEAKHQGARNAGKTVLISGGAKIETLAQTVADLQLLEIRQFDAKTICSLFGVPPEVVGLGAEAQYSHGPAQQRFICNTVIPMLNYIAENITRGILSRFKNHKVKNIDFAESKLLFAKRWPLNKRKGYLRARAKAMQDNQQLFAWFAIEEHPTMQELLDAKIEKVLNYCDKGIPLNEVIDAYDLPFEHQPWGNDWWVTMGLVPARFTLEAGVDGLTGPSAPEGEGEGDKKPEAGNKSLEVEQNELGEIEKSKQRIWENWVASWRPVERGYEQAIRTLFVHQQSELIKKLKAAYQPNKTKDSDDIIAHVVFDLKKEDGKLRAINQTFFEKASEIGIRQAASEVLGLAGKALDEFAEAVLRDPAIRATLLRSAANLSGLNKFTQQKLAESLKAGLDKEENLNQLVKRVQNLLSDNRSRALRIARTQTGGAVSGGRHAGMKHAGVELKGWLTSRDSNVRQIHKDAEITYAKGIPVEQAFWVGGDALIHPGDPGASPANIINCRCCEIAIQAKGKTLGIEHYRNIKFYDFENLEKDKDVKNGKN